VVPRFYVSYRFLFFHHVAALPWGFNDDIIIMHAPFGKQGQPGVFCVSGTARLPPYLPHPP
jgi:hypothetical protein